MNHLENSEFPDRLEAKLDNLFASYRAAVPDPEPGAGFMPAIWRGIEGRRSIPTSLRHLAQSFITAAAAICLVIAVFLLRPATPAPVFLTASYVDVLASDPAPERLAYAEISREEPDSEDVQR
jgi:hypothetical protein